MHRIMQQFPSRAWRALFVAAAIAVPMIPAAAQYAAPVISTHADPGATLADAMHVLATDPKNLGSLLSAGRASIDLGDMQAAAGFFGRAEEYYPASPAAKIGVGAAMTMIGDAKGGMAYFDKAQALGAPQSQYALDRGLAFDLLGQQSRAQADYRVAMFGPQADEARRRLALSLAISKDIRGAAATLEPLLARRDPAAVRTNAFVLALAGDREGARRTIDAALPGAGARFEPFFRLLPVLRPDEKAMAVHLGEFPKDAATRVARAEPVPSSPVLTISNRAEQVIQPARRPVVTQQAQVTPPKAGKPRPPVGVADAPRRAVRQAVVPSTYLAMIRPSLDPSRYASTRRKPTPPQSTDVKPADPEPRPGFVHDELAPVPDSPEPLVPVNSGGTVNRDGEPIVTAQADELLPPPPSTPKLEIRRPPPPRPKVELAKIEPKSKAKPAPARDAPDKKKKEAPKPKEPPSPYFVQLASGAHADRMSIEYKRIKARKPALFAGRTAQVTNGKELFRLVIGPFKSREASGEFVNQLAKAGIDGFSYTAPDGMTFEKIATK
jgi:tetratricopeptide (TPR) repeat protein